MHSEDRDDLLRYLMWNSQLPADRANISVQHMLQSPGKPESASDGPDHRFEVLSKVDRVEITCITKPLRLEL